MQAISNFLQKPVIKSIRTGLKHQACAMAVVATLVPAIANARTNTIKSGEPINTEFFAKGENLKKYDTEFLAKRNETYTRNDSLWRLYNQKETRLPESIACSNNQASIVDINAYLYQTNLQTQRKREELEAEANKLLKEIKVLEKNINRLNKNLTKGHLTRRIMEYKYSNAETYEERRHSANSANIDLDIFATLISVVMVTIGLATFNDNKRKACLFSIVGPILLIALMDGFQFGKAAKINSNKESSEYMEIYMRLAEEMKGDEIKLHNLKDSYYNIQAELQNLK